MNPPSHDVIKWNGESMNELTQNKILPTKTILKCFGPVAAASKLELLFGLVIIPLEEKMSIIIIV